MFPISGLDPSPILNRHLHVNATAFVTLVENDFGPDRTGRIEPEVRRGRMPLGAGQGRSAQQIRSSPERTERMRTTTPGTGGYQTSTEWMGSVPAKYSRISSSSMLWKSSFTVEPSAVRRLTWRSLRMICSPVVVFLLQGR